VEICLKCVILATNFQKPSSAGILRRLQLSLTFDFSDLKLRDFAKLWLFKLIIVVVIVINFISGILNNINNKENNSKPKKDTATNDNR